MAVQDLAERSLGNLPEEVDDESVGGLTPADLTADDAPARTDAPDEIDTPEPVTAEPAAKPEPWQEKYETLEREIQFLRAGQLQPAPAPAAAPAQPDVKGMIDGVLGPYKLTAAEVSEAMQDPQKMAELLYGLAQVSTGAGAALGLQAAQSTMTQQQRAQAIGQARVSAFSTKYPNLTKYSAVVSKHATDLNAELGGRDLPPHQYADIVAARTTNELQTYGIDPNKEARTRRLRPAMGERGGQTGSGGAPRRKAGDKKQDQIKAFLQ